MSTPGYLTVRLSRGSVALRGWEDRAADAYLYDLLILTNTLTLIRHEWSAYRAEDVTEEVWAAFWRLVNASLDGTPLPDRLTWNDRLLLWEAMWSLNPLEDTGPKLTALSERAARLTAQLTSTQGRTTPAPKA